MFECLRVCTELYIDGKLLIFICTMLLLTIDYVLCLSACCHMQGSLDIGCVFCDATSSKTVTDHTDRGKVGLKNEFYILIL